jgi:hypothetical protein
MTLEAMRDDLIEYISDEILDIANELTEEEIADCVLAIASRLLLPAKVVEHEIKDYGYIVKINNTHGGWVSVSDMNTGDTGVSRTEFYPFYKDDEDGYFAGLCSLASMINEAWYLCNN